MAHWTSKNAILRDLSLAQGREVPVELENTVGFNEKPPALNYTEGILLNIHYSKTNILLLFFVFCIY